MQATVSKGGLGLLNQGRRIDRLAGAADLEVQLVLAAAAAVTDAGDGSPARTVAPAAL